MSTSTTDPAPLILPTIGRVVYAVLDDGPNEGVVRPAIITRVWSPTVVGLVILLDGINDWDIDPIPWMGASDVDLESKAGASRKAQLQRQWTAGLVLKHGNKWAYVQPGPRDAPEPKSWHWMSSQIGQAARAEAEIAALRSALQALSMQVATLQAAAVAAPAPTT